MKYSEAKKKIKDYLKSFFDENWGDLYEIRDEDDALFLVTHIGPSDQLQDILMVSKQEEGWFEAKNLTGFEKPLADIFMELALTPLEEREEEKRHVVKVWNRNDPLIIAKDHDTDSFSILPLSAVKEINGLADSPAYQATFTQAEINHMKYIISLNLDWDKAVEEYDGEI